MNHVMQPNHAHPHKVWVIPDTRLGRWTAALFTGAALTLIVVPILAQVIAMLTAPGGDSPWFFALWGAMLLALGLALITGVVALVALVKDHAVLLLVPVAMGVLGAGLLFASAGWPV